MSCCPSRLPNKHRYSRFRQKWAFSIKTNIGGGVGRARGYWESDDLFTNTDWVQNKPTGPWDGPKEVYPWAWADTDDDSDPQTVTPRTVYAQLYTVDAIAYESVMVGLFAVLECDWCECGYLLDLVALAVLLTP